MALEISCISDGGKASGPGVSDIAATARKLTISCIVSGIREYDREPFPSTLWLPKFAIELLESVREKTIFAYLSSAMWGKPFVAGNLTSYLSSPVEGPDPGGVVVTASRVL